ncbi:protein SON isoform X3 [Eleutherodactylus coqui]|uniref:protein SON isoform X3 n=1 Tax=Eleutherodactylus coqui TaxID=57060 RepID=UPI003461FBE6
MKIAGRKSDLSISQAGTGAAALQCEDPTIQIPITLRPGPLENMDSSHNGELPAPGTEDAPEGSSANAQNEGSSQTVTQTEETEPKPMEIVKSQNLEVEKESESKDLKTTDLSSDDEVKKDSSKKKSKKHKKHKSKKKKKKKKKEKNEKRSKSTSSVEDQENASSDSKSAWKPVTSSPREQDKLNTLSSQNEQNVDALPSLGVQDHNVDSAKVHPARPALDTDSGFFGPKCPNEMDFSVSSNLAVCEVEMQEPSKESAIDCQQNNENVKCTDQTIEKQHTNCETAETFQKETSLAQPGLVLLEGISVELGGSRLTSEGNKDLKQSDNISSIVQPLSKSTSANQAKSRSRSHSLAREIRSRSKSLTKVPKKQANSKSLTRQRSRSSSAVRRQRSRSSSVGRRRRSKSPVRRRRSQSSTSVRYSKSPIRSWWSKSIKNRQRSVSIERRRRSRTRSLAKRHRSRSRSSEKGRHSRTRSSAKRMRSRSRSANRRRKSRSASRKRRLRTRSASRRKSKSAVRTPSKSSSPSRRQKSKSASPLRRQKSKTPSPVKRRKSRSRSAVQKRRSRSGATSRRHRSRSGSCSKRRQSRSRYRSGSTQRRRRSRSSLASRRRKSRSGSVFRRRRSKSAMASRRRRSASPSVSRRQKSRSPSVSRRRKTRSPSVSRRRKTRSPSVSRRRKTRSPSVSRRRKTRSPSVSRRRKTRSPSVSRRRKTRSPSVSRRRKTRSPSVSRRRRTRSPSVSRRRRTRSPSVSRRRKSRSPSVSRRRKSRSPSVSRRRKSRSPSVSRRRKSRSPSVSRRRRSRSPSVSRRRRSRSPSVSRRRRSRSPSVSRRRRSRSPSVSRRRRTRSPSVSRRRRTRSPSVSRRRRTRSPSVSRRRSSRSPSVSRRHRSRSVTASRRRKSRSASDTRRPRSRSGSGVERRKSRSYSATKRKSTSVAREEQSTLMSSASKVQSGEDKLSSCLERRSRSKEKNEKSMPRSGSVILKSKSVENVSTLQSKTSTDQKMPEAMSLDEKQLSSSAPTVKSFGPDVSTVEKQDEAKLPDMISTSVTESESGPYAKNAVNIESSVCSAAHNILDSSLTTSVLDDHMKSTYSKCPAEEICSNIPFDETISTECDMDIDQSPSPTQIDCIEQPIEDINLVETSKEAYDIEGASGHTEQHTTIGELRVDEETVQKSLGSSDFESTGYSKSEFSEERSMVVPLEDKDPISSYCHNKLNVEVKPELAYKNLGSLCQPSEKARENSADHIATSSNVKLSSTEPLPNCIEGMQDSESIEYMTNADTDLPEINNMAQKGSVPSALSDHTSTTVKQGIPALLAENVIDCYHNSSTIDHVTSERESCVSPVIKIGLDLLKNKQENNMDSLIINESQTFPVLGSPSSILPASRKRNEEAVHASVLNDDFCHQRDTPNSQPPISDEDNLNKGNESKEEIVAASRREAVVQRVELKVVNNTLTVEQRLPSAPKQSSSPNICISSETENGSASSYVDQNYLLDNSTNKALESKDYNFKETGNSEVSQPIESKTIEVKPVKNNPLSSSLHISEDLSSTCQIEESNNLPVSSPHDATLLNTSLLLNVNKLNVHSSPQGGNHESTSMETKSASESAFQNIPVPPNADHHEISTSKHPATLDGASITNLTTLSSPSKISTSTEIIHSSSEKNLEYMSVTSVNNEMSALTDSTEDAMEIQTPCEALSSTNNTESDSADCKIISKPTVFNNMNDSCAKRDVMYVDATHLESSANSIPNSDHKVICQIEEKNNSREQNSLTVLCSEKQSSGAPKSYGNLESLHMKIQENESLRNIVGHTVSNTEIAEHSQSVSLSKDSEQECLSSQEKSIKPCTSGSSPSLYIQQKVIPKNEEMLNLEEESLIQSLTEINQSKLETVQQSAKGELTLSGLEENKSLEDPKLSPKPFLHETGRLSVPVQFKFSKTFKTLGVSQLCSTSEDSSDVESSKANTSSSGVTRNSTASTSHSSKSSSKASQEPTTTQQTALPSKSFSPTASSQDLSTELSQSDHQSGNLPDRDLLQSDNQAADDSQSSSSNKHTFPHISNAVSKLGVKQRQYRSRSVAQDSRTPSVDRGHASRSRSKSRRRRSHSKSSSRKKRSQSTARKKSSHSKSVRKKRSRSRSRGRKRRSQSKSKGKKKRSTSKLSGKRKRSKSKSSEKIGGSKSLGKHRNSRSTSKTRKCRLQSKSPERKERSRSKSEARKSLHSKTASTRKKSRSKSPNRRRKSRSKSLSSRSRSRSVSASWKRFSHSKSLLHRKRSRSSSRSASPRRRSRSRNKRHSFSRSPVARSNSRSRSRWHRSRSRGRWRRSRSLSTSRRRSRSTSRLSSSLSTKKRKSLSPVRRRRSRSQIKQKDKSPVSKRKSASPPPLVKKSVQSKPAGFKHSIGLKSLIQKQLSQAKSQGSTGKLSKDQIALPNVTNRTQLSIFSIRTQASMSNLNNIGQIPVPNLAEVPLPSMSAGSQVPMPSAPPTDPLSVSSLAAETQLSVPDLTTANQWHVPDMSSGAAWSMPDIAAGTQWSMADLGAGTQWPISDLTAGSHWPMHDLTGAQWSMPDLAAGTQWAVPDVATGTQWAVPDLAAGTQWTVPDLTAGSQWAMTNLAAGAQWAVPDLAATAQWTVPDLTAGAQMQRADLAPEAQVPGSDLALEAQVPGSDLAAEAQVPGSDLATEAQVPGSDMVAEAQLPPEHDLTPEEHNVMPDVAAEALVPVASSTFVPDVAAGIPLPDVAAAAQIPVPDVATIHMPDVATEAQKQMSGFVATQTYMSLSPEESVEDSNFGEPIVSSEHQTESDAFVEQLSFQPNVNTAQNVGMEETLSSVQQLPVDFENSQFADSNHKMSLDKSHLQLNQEPVTDILIYAPQVEPGMDSECPLSSETCRSSDVPITYCESSDYSNIAIAISSPVHSIPEESNAMQEHSLVDNPLQCEPHVHYSNTFVESQSSPIQTECVELRNEHDQPLLAVTNSPTISNVEVELCNKAEHNLVEEPYSISVCSKWVAPYASPDNVLLNEPPVNSNTTAEISSHSISEIDEIEACTPNNSHEVEQSPSLGHPYRTEPYSTPKQPQLVEPYSSPDHPQLVEPYTSPVHPQLVESYSSPQHPPLVELYSSPDRPQLVEPYASPEFPQLVEPYASPDRQQLVEPYTDAEHAQICQPCRSPVLTENLCSPDEKPEVHSISGHTLIEATVTCTQIDTDSSCSDGSEINNIFPKVHENLMTSEVPKNEDEIVDSDYSQLRRLNDASVSLQEVPCPSLLTAYSLESNFSPKESTSEESSPTEKQSMQTSMESHLEHSTSPTRLSTKHLSSPYTLHQDETFPITDDKPFSSCSSSDEPKLDIPCATTNEELLDKQFVTDEHSQSKELCSDEVNVQPHNDFISSEQVQEKLYNAPFQTQENLPSPSIPDANEQCLNAADVPLIEYEYPPAEDPPNHPEKNLCIPVISNTIINLHGVDSSCTIISLPDLPEQETITETSYSEESEAASDRLLETQVKVLEKPSASSDPVVLQDSQDACCSSPSKELSNSDCPSSFLPEHSSDVDHSLHSESSTKMNQRLVETIKTDDSNIVFRSEELALDRYVENTLPTENASVPEDLQCSASNEATDLSVECIKHDHGDASECIKTDNHFTTTPPDLLPYDSDQPTDMCSENSSEPVPFNSQPPPELLPYDSEQPANSFLSISDSPEQGSSVFHAPPELLPYDSDQPIVLHSQQTEPSGEELPVSDSTTIHHEPYKTLDLLSKDSVENCADSASLNIQEIPEKCEPSNKTDDSQINLVKDGSSECSIVEFPSREHTFTSEIVQEHSVPSTVCSQEYPSSSWSLTEHLPEREEHEQPVEQPVLGLEIPEPLISRCEKQTEETSLLTNVSEPAELQCSSSYELNTSESETSKRLPAQDEISVETAKKSSPPKSFTNTECTQSAPTSRKTGPISELKSRHEHSRSRSRDRKNSRSKSASKNKRSRSKSVTRAKKSRSKSLVKSKRIKSRSASTESNRRSPVGKRKESTYVVHKRSSRSASVGRRKRSRSSSLSPRKRSRSSSVDRRCRRRRSHSRSRQRHSRSPSEFQRRSRSPSVTSRRRSRSPSVTRKRRSPSTSVTRKKTSPSPATRRKRSLSATRRRRTPSPNAIRRRRTPSPSTSRRRRSPSASRRRRSRSPSASRRRRSRSPSASRRRRSRSPSATRRRRSPSPSAARRRRSPSASAARRRRSPSPAAARRRRSPSPAASRRRRSPSSSEFRRKRSPSLSVSRKRHSPSPSVPRKRRSRSTSVSRRRRSRSASQRKRSRSPSAPRKRRSKSKSPSKSPVGKPSKSDRSRSVSQSKVLRKRKSRSSSNDKKGAEKRRKRSSSKDSSKDYYSIKQRRKSRTPPRRKKSRSPTRRASVCKSPVRRRRSRSPVRRKSFSRSPLRRKRSRSRDKSMDSARSPKRLTDLDKAQLLEIAKANAAAMCAKAGVPLPPSLKPAISPATPMEEKITHRTYGVTIQELTEKCKQIAQSKEDDVIVNKPHDSDDEEEDRPFYNHPFKVSEHKPISFSLLNPSLKPAPKNQVTLTKEFPVSSGSQHRKKESDKVYGEWVPVDKNTEESKDDVFTNTGPAQPVDITSAMNERAVAQTRLTGNPYDIEALYMLNRAQEQIDAWAQSTSIPGQFTGSTGAQVLSAEEISNSGPQAWLKKQVLKRNRTPV